ncbi:Leucine rich repeat/RNI-like superfamily protein [Klebsormidium nitens]|uniref:Leucine rich repeat/RNI-like superfamily protein n=1 Tax=Klebsormidium nitens TaxID=105231 RepID=A0A1Y1IHB4_KLENI|nr:Leucine rich repeat/RNI-like superfamily protein [Klebsormidium nitens]|eukprot:GAQ90063.1 Leucine rich repeat/RNI-like superfamily protein [Klebsormidium nitens]
MEFLRRCSGLTRFEEELVAQSRRLVGEAIGLGERISLQVSRATGDAVVNGYQSIFSPAPLSQSPSLATSQDDEVLASSALLQEQHTCEETSETQGPAHTHDPSFDLVPESSSLALPGLAGALPSSPPLSSSQDISAHSPQLAEQQTLREDKSDAQGPEQKHDASEVAVPAALDYELVSSALLASNDVSSPLFERGLFGSAEGALPVGGEESFDREEGSGSVGSQELVLAEPSEAACRVEELEGWEVDHGDGAGGAVFRGREQGSTIQDLDVQSLSRIMSCLGNASLQACSLVCREWLVVSNDTRDYLTLCGGPQVARLPRIVARFSDLRFVMFKDLVRSSGEGQGLVTASLDDASLRLLAQSCPRLVRLSLVHCGVVSDEGLAAVLTGCLELRTLRLDRCEGFRGKAFEGVKCKLEELCLFSCTGLKNIGLLAAGKACPALRTFDLRAQGERADLGAGLKRVAWHCGKLEKLFLQACGTTDLTLREFAIHCPQLTCVAIMSEPDITDSGVWSLRCHLRSLERLTLLKNDQLMEIPRSGRFLRLKSLGIGRFSRTPDDMLRRLAKEASLEDLRIISCRTLTDATVRKILLDCRHLTRFVIADCELVTSEILTAYKESNSKARLIIRDCKGVLAEMVPAEMLSSGKVVLE